MFLKASWYVAAWDWEVKERPVGRTVLGEPIVIFRDGEGRPFALQDSCPHRRLPLSMGSVVGDRLRCGYHGMAFDGKGRCADIPGQTKIPPAAAVRSFPLVERWNLLWVWMGDPAAADPSRIIDVPHYEDPQWAINRGPPMDVACDYRLMNDNLLDPTHVSYVHASSLGNEDTIGIPVETRADGDQVVVRRWILNHQLAPFFSSRVKFAGAADRLQHYELRLPSTAVIKDVIAPAGSGAPDGRLAADTWLVDSFNFVTPVDDQNCRYFWFQLRNYDVNDPAESEALTADFVSAFTEDLVVLAAVQKGLRSSPAGMDLAADRGGNQARRILDKMIRAESLPIS